MKADMSAKAITNRLKRVSQLRKLCLSLGKAKEIKQADNLASFGNRSVSGISYNN